MFLSTLNVAMCTNILFHASYTEIYNKYILLHILDTAVKMVNLGPNAAITLFTAFTINMLNTCGYYNCNLIILFIFSFVNGTFYSSFTHLGYYLQWHRIKKKIISVKYVTLTFAHEMEISDHCAL